MWLHQIRTSVLYISNCNSYESLFQRPCHILIYRIVYKYFWRKTTTRKHFKDEFWALYGRNKVIFVGRSVGLSGFGHGGSVDGRGRPAPGVDVMHVTSEPTCHRPAPPYPPLALPGTLARLIYFTIHLNLIMKYYQIC